MTYFLDTNACVAVINGRPAAVRERVRGEVGRGESVVVSSITAFELWYGVTKSARVEANTERLAAFLGTFATVPFDGEDAASAGGVRTELERRGTPIGGYDSMIAGHALRHGATLVTANVKEFRRVSGLRWENWAA